MSLTSLCITNIADMVVQLPPMVQDMVIKESRQVIKNQVKDELREESKQEVRVDIQKEATDHLSFIVPEIMTDMVSSMTSGGNHQDYYREYPNVPKFIVKCAIDIAERSVSTMEERYVHQSFAIARNSWNTDFDDTEDEYY